MLVLDEPTNDLDLVTLNVLERLLLDFDGSVLLVTHDRYFLDKVATAILAFEGDGRVVRYPGNYEMYRTLREQAGPAPPRPGGGGGGRERTSRRSAPRQPGGAQARQALLQGAARARRDGARHPGAEQRKAALEATLSDPATYQREGAAVSRAARRAGGGGGRGGAALRAVAGARGVTDRDCMNVTGSARCSRDETVCRPPSPEQRRAPCARIAPERHGGPDRPGEVDHANQDSETGFTSPASTNPARKTSTATRA